MAKKNYIILILLFVFIFPMVAGWFFYYYHARFNFGTTNHGKLINPPLATHLNLEKKWYMVYVPKKNCDSTCEQTFFFLHQVKKLLGKEAYRVAVIKSSEIKNFKTADLKNNAVYIIDPQGYLFMYYKEGTKPLDIFKDLKHVLKVSQIG